MNDWKNYWINNPSEWDLCACLITPVVCRNEGRKERVNARTNGELNQWEMNEWINGQKDEWIVVPSINLKN